MSEFNLWKLHQQSAPFILQNHSYDSLTTFFAFRHTQGGNGGEQLLMSGGRSWRAGKKWDWRKSGDKLGKSDEMIWRKRPLHAWKWGGWEFSTEVYDPILLNRESCEYNFIFKWNPCVLRQALFHFEQVNHVSSAHAFACATYYL